MTDETPKRPKNPDGPNRAYTGNDLDRYRLNYSQNVTLATDLHTIQIARRLVDAGIGDPVILDAIEDGIAANQNLSRDVREKAVGDVKTIR